MNAYDRAVAELYQAPHAAFVSERKRLAGELKAAGHRDEATRLGKLPRPTISAWVVNQLYWHARDAFDRMLAAADKVRKGNLGAATEHREAIATLRQRAAALLKDAGHAATESTLRRVTQTLSALAVAGGFDPDPPGALAEDRDAPGFEAIGIPSHVEAPTDGDGHSKHPEAKRAAAKHAQKHAEKHAEGKHMETKHSRRELAKLRAEAKERAEAEAAAERAEEQARKRREEEERKRVAAERHRLEAALRTAKGDVHAREREVTSLEKQLAKAKDAVARAQEVVDELEKKLEGN